MKLLSLVIPLYDESIAFPSLRARLEALCAVLEARYQIEIILVDDGSKDETWKLIATFAGRDQRVRGVRFSRNFGHQVALYCGYEFAGGDVVVSLDGDLQDPPEVVLDMLGKFEAGADIVYAIRNQRYGETWFKRSTAAVFYRLLSWLGDTRAPLDSGDFRLLSRRALDALLKLREKHKFIRGMVGWIGYRTAEVRYDRPPRVAGVTKFNLAKMVRFAVDGIVAFSRFPLRLAFVSCVLAMVPFLSYLAISLVQATFGLKQLVPGWTSLLLCVIVFGSLNLIALGIVGEYLGRVFESLKQRPDYLVMETTAPRGSSRDAQTGGPTAPM
jgi:dolichol-phosphate mannosyltransferase